MYRIYQMHGIHSEQCLMIWQAVSVSVHAARVVFNVACPTCGIQLTVTFPLSFADMCAAFLEVLWKRKFCSN